MDLQLTPNLTPEQQEAVYAILRAYNHSLNQTFFTLRELPENAPQPLNIVAFDANQTVIAGLLAETQFAWLKISIMAVAASVRRQGLGRRLMERAEQEAQSRGCRHAYLDTMDYQAPDFYRKLGYQLAGELKNWDSHGHTKFLFTKNLI